VKNCCFHKLLVLVINEQAGNSLMKAKFRNFYNY
jgi:hypothetical protein